MQTGIEQRNHRRYNLSLPVRVQAKDRAAAPVEASSKDISGYGIYLILSEEFELGAELELEIALPAKLFGWESVRVHCRGRIARVERMDSPANIGVGITIESYEFVRC